MIFDIGLIRLLYKYKKLLYDNFLSLDNKIYIRIRILRFTDFLNRIDLLHDYQTNSTTCRFEPSNFTFNVRMKVPFYNNLRMQQHNKYNTYNRE